MFAKTQFQTQFAYHWHTNKRLLETAVQLDEAEVGTSVQAENEYGRGGIYDLFLHLFQADQGWRRALETGQQVAVPGRETYPDLAALQAAFAEEETAWSNFLDDLSPVEIEATVELTTRRNTQFAAPRWRILQHVLFHGMQHHTELAQLLTAKGHSPGDIDFLFFTG